MKDVKEAYNRHKGLTGLIYSPEWESFTLSDMYRLMDSETWTPVGIAFLENAIKARKERLLRSWSES